MTFRMRKRGFNDYDVTNREVVDIYRDIYIRDIYKWQIYIKK